MASRIPSCCFVGLNQWLRRCWALGSRSFCTSSWKSALVNHFTCFSKLSSRKLTKVPLMLLHMRRGTRWVKRSWFVSSSNTSKCRFLPAWHNRPSSAINWTTWRAKMCRWRSSIVTQSLKWRRKSWTQFTVLVRTVKGQRGTKWTSNGERAVQVVWFSTMRIQHRRATMNGRKSTLCTTTGFQTAPSLASSQSNSRATIILAFWVRRTRSPRTSTKRSTLRNTIQRHHRSVVPDPRSIMIPARMASSIGISWSITIPSIKKAKEPTSLSVKFTSRDCWQQKVCIDCVWSIGESWK